MSESINLQNTDCIAVDTLKQLIANKYPLTIIDVRSEEEYELLHVPGAVHIPGDALPEASKIFTSDHLYITACGKGGGRSSHAAEWLRKSNLNAMALCGGTFAWFMESEPPTN